MRRGLLLVAMLLSMGVFVSGKVTISFWYGLTAAAQQEALNALIQKFMTENPDITVDLVFQGNYGSLQQKLIAAVAAGQPPTLAHQYENWTTQWVDALVDLDLLLPQELLDDLLPAFDTRFDGRVVTVPFNKSILVLYYRPDLIPNPPKTWAEFEAEVARIGKDEAKGVYGTAFRPPNPEVFLTLLHQAGGSILSEDWSATTINNAEGLAAAEFASRLAKYALVQSAYVSDAVKKGITVAMWIDTSAGYPPNMDAARVAGVPLAVAPLPCNVNCASMIQGTNLAIFSPNQSRAQIEAAAKLIEFLLREDNIVYWAQKTGYLPVTRTAIYGQLWQDYIAGKPEQKVMTDQLIAGGFGQLLHPRYMDMRNLLITYWELLLKGEDSPKAILDALAAEIEALRK